MEGHAIARPFTLSHSILAWFGLAPNALQSDPAMDYVRAAGKRIALRIKADPPDKVPSAHERERECVRQSDRVSE